MRQKGKIFYMRKVKNSLIVSLVDGKRTIMFLSQESLRIFISVQQQWHARGEEEDTLNGFYQREIRWSEGLNLAILNFILVEDLITEGTFLKKTFGKIDTLILILPINFCKVPGKISAQDQFLRFSLLPIIEFISYCII